MVLLNRVSQSTRPFDFQSENFGDTKFSNFWFPGQNPNEYPASRGPSIFLDKPGRGRDLCQPPRLSLICRSSTETDESVPFETSFSRFGTVRMCFPRNCWLNARPQYTSYTREIQNNGGGFWHFSFERCIWESSEKCIGKNEYKWNMQSLTTPVEGLV